MWYYIVVLKIFVCEYIVLEKNLYKIGNIFFVSVLKDLNSLKCW